MKNWLYSLFGNSRKVIPLILTFVLVFIIFAVRCSRAGELHLETGSQVITGTGAYIGFYYRWTDPTLDRVGFEVGTQMLGRTAKTANNWAPFGQLTVGVGPVSAGLGFTYLQDVDALDGSHLNYALGLRYQTPWDRLGVALRHISNAGTTDSNVGRNMVALDWRLQ